MILQLKDFLLSNWDNLHIPHEKPDDLVFIKFPSRQQVKGALTSFLIFSSCSRGPLLYAKIAITTPTITSLNNEYYNLVAILKKVKSISLKKTFPKPLFLGKINNKEYVLLETASVGRDMIDDICVKGIFRERTISQYFHTALSWLIQFQKETEAARVRVVDKFKDFIQEPIVQFKHTFPREGKEFSSFFMRLKSHFKKFKNESFPIVSIHGDFNFYNIFVKNDTLSVIDWEDSIVEFLPFIDAFHFPTVSAIQLSNTGDLKKGLTHSHIGTNWLHPIITGYYNRYCTEIGINPALLSLFFPIYLIIMANKAMAPYRNHPELAQVRLNLLRSAIGG
ncbi:hypothetical protein KAW65_03750 [candidate division WOR-3 bacterium]|nr:hypothetical protein [candidate division WOR-3 bacterium]